MDGDEFLKPVSMHTNISRRFPIWYFFSVTLSESRCIFDLKPSPHCCNSFSIFFIHSIFHLWSLSSHIWFQNCFAFLAFHGRCLWIISPDSSNFLSLFWYVLFCLYSLILSRYFFKSLFFRQDFQLVSNRVVLLFLSQHIFEFFLLS